MEQEFKRTGLSGGSPSFSKLVIQGLRKGREEHPVLDMAAGFVPGVGAVQSAMDVTDPEASTLDKILAATEFVPGGKLLGKVGSYMGDVVDFKKLKQQKKTAEQLRKGQNQSVQATSDLENMLANVDKIDTSGPKRKLPSEAYFKNAEDEGDFLMGGDAWEKKNLKWDEKGNIFHPKDGWVGPDHPEYLEPLSEYERKVADHRAGIIDQPAYSPEEIFQKPDIKVTTSPETVADANRRYTEQLLREEGENVKDFGKSDTDVMIQRLRSGLDDANKKKTKQLEEIASTPHEWSEHFDDPMTAAEIKDTIDFIKLPPEGKAKLKDILQGKKLRYRMDSESMYDQFPDEKEYEKVMEDFLKEAPEDFHISAGAGNYITGRKGPKSMSLDFGDPGQSAMTTIFDVLPNLKPVK